MATISVIKPEEVDTHVSRHGNVKSPYLVERDLVVSELIAKKGSALAAADVIEAIKLPKQTALLAVFVGKLEASDATTLTFDVGVSADPDGYIDGYDAQAAAVDSVATAVVTPAPLNVTNAGDTVDVTLATLTGTLTAGKFRVAALVVDITDAVAPGRAALGS